MKLTDYLKEGHIYIAESFKDTANLYHTFSQFLKEQSVIRDPRAVKRLFIKRESIQSTGIGKGAATPHIFSKEFSHFTVFVVLIRQGLDFNAPDGQPVFLVFLIMSDDRDVGLHLKTLAHISRLVMQTDLVEKAKIATHPQEIYRLVADRENMI